MIPSVDLLFPGAGWLVGVLVKVTVLLVAAAILAVGLRRASAAVRHLVWSGAIVAVLALPILAAVLPWRLPVITVAASRVVSPVVPLAPEVAAPDESAGEPAARREPLKQQADVPPATGATAASDSSAPSVLTVLTVLWLAGTVLLLLRLAVGALFLARVARRASPLGSPDWTRPLLEAADRLGLDRAPRLLMSGRLPMPYASGLLSPSIVLPESAAEWDDRRRRAVLCHELAHLRRLDLVLNAVGQLACAVWWFHPLVWVAARKLRTESERACDDLVLGVGTRASEYADHLLHIVCGALRARTPAVALPMAQQHEFEGRMLAILDRDARRGHPTLRHAAVLAVLGVFIVLPVAALGVSRADAPPSQGPGMATDLAMDEEQDRSIDEGVGVPLAAPSPTPVEQPPVEQPAVRSEQSVAPVQRQQQDTGAQRVVAALLKALDDPVADVRRDAAYALGNLGAPGAVSALEAKVARDPDPAMREMATWALGQIGSRAATAVLGDAARRDSTEDVRAMAVWALGQLSDPQSVPALTAVLADRSEEVRGRAAWALGTIGARPAPAALITALGDHSPDVRMRAAWALGQIQDPAAVSGLVTAFGDPDADVRKAAFWAAAQMPGEGAQSALLAALEHADPEIRAMAARALGGSDLDPWPWPWPMPLHR
jgi:HEAT repeat protein/beta-lactamase regulating signal transducer with metallopeptidase domain